MQRNNIKHVLTIILYDFYFFDKLININAILFDSWSVLVHDLLTNITTLCSLRHNLLWRISTIGKATWHVLHFHISNRFLTINLTNKSLHTFLQTLRYLLRHLRNNIHYLLLSNLSLNICFYQVQKVEFAWFLLTHLLLLHIVLLSLHLVVVIQLFK